MEEHERSLKERVESLEQQLRELRSLLELYTGKRLRKEPESRAKTAEEAVAAAPAPWSAPRTVPEPVSGPVSAVESIPEKTEPADTIWKSEYWMNKVGIGLLLFGVAFLFKYSIDQGWLTPLIRVVFGLALGAGLGVTGLRIHASRRHFSQVLLGGAIATFYITGFAAFQLYKLVPGGAAYAFMVSVTVTAFFLSLRQNEAALSLIAALGGLGTPFMLYTGAGSFPGFIAYTCLILAGTSAIYMYRGWRSLLWISAAVGWAVLTAGGIMAMSSGPGHAATGDRWAFQLGIVFCWLAFWAVPVMREALRVKNPGRWNSTGLDTVQDSGLVSAGQVQKLSSAHALTVLTIFVAWGLTQMTWLDLVTNVTRGWITVGISLVYGLAFLALRKHNLADLAYVHVLVVLALFTTALCLLLKGHVLFFALAAEASALHLAARRVSDQGTAVSAHFLFAAVAVMLLQRLLPDLFARHYWRPVLNARALTDLAVIALGVGLSWMFRSRAAVNFYRMAAHVAFLVWLLRELSVLSHGQAYVTIAWGVYGVALMVLSLRLNLDQVRTVASGTLLLVVGKLFLVDLSRLEAIWRILLFLGFGGLFLVLSYYFRALWKSSAKQSDSSA